MFLEVRLGREVVQRNPAIAHFKGPIDFMHGLLGEMLYCQYIELSMAKTTKLKSYKVHTCITIK